MSNEKNQKLMEKIAVLLREESGSDDSSFLRESLEKINRRLDNIENQLAVKSPKPENFAAVSNHPSLHKVTFIEEIVDTFLANQTDAKNCTFEPHNKPCDNCSLCNSRGF